MIQHTTGADRQVCPSAPIAKGASTMSTAVYLRVSSKSQRIDSQQREVQRYLDGHGITDARWFVDTMSGAKVDRPGLAELRKAVFSGQVRTVVLYRLPERAPYTRAFPERGCTSYGGGVPGGPPF